MVLLIALLAALGVTTAVVLTAAGGEDADQAVVTHLVDGDTLDVSVGGRAERIRLLNVDAPEVTGPDAATACLGAEASAHLEALIPVGTPVRLEYDRERTDPYDRTLAGVFTPDGALVNAEMARAGLAVPVVFGDNDRFHPPVVEARDEAAAQQRGLFSPEVACTVPGQVATAVAAVTGAPVVTAHPAGAPSGELAASAALASAALATARGLEDAFAAGSGLVWQALTPDERGRLAEQVRSARETAERGAGALHEATAAARVREEEAARAERVRQAEEARRAEEQRRAAEEREQRQRAERQREQEREQERRAAAERSDRERADRDPAPSAGDGGNPYPGYTGPRCYAPGGRTWRPC